MLRAHGCGKRIQRECFQAAAPVRLPDGSPVGRERRFLRIRQAVIGGNNENDFSGFSGLGFEFERGIAQRIIGRRGLSGRNCFVTQVARPDPWLATRARQAARSAASSPAA